MEDCEDDREIRLPFIVVSFVGYVESVDCQEVTGGGGDGCRCLRDGHI